MTDRWTDEMLDTLTGVVSRNAGDITQLRGIMENFALQMEFFIQEGREHRQGMQVIQSEIRDIQVEIRDMQSDIRGLQTENRRILERLERLD